MPCEPRKQNQKIRLAVTAVCAVVSAVLAFALRGAGPLWCTLAQGVFALPVFVLNTAPFTAAWRSLARRAPGATVPMVAGVLLLTVGGACTFLPAGLAAAAWVVAVQALGKAAETALLSRARPALPTLPEAPFAPGEEFIVPAGAVVQADGVVKQGISTVEESALTGLDERLDVFPGSSIRAGAVNGESSLFCRAERVGPDTVLATAGAKAMAAAETEPPQAGAAAAEDAKLVPEVLLCALVVGLLWLLATQNPATALLHAAAVLVVANPTLQGLGVASASIAALHCGAKNGMVFESSAALYKAGGVATVMVNQKGSVTTGEPAVAEIEGTRNVPEKFLLSLAAGLEQYYDHPLARAVLKRAQADGLKYATVVDFVAHPGQGVCGKVAGKDLVGGSATFVGGYCTISDAVREAGAKMEENGMTPLYFSLAGHLAGIVGVAEAVKAEAKTAVTELDALGVNTVLLSPEPAGTADHIGAVIGLADTDVIAGVPPEDGADAVRSLRDRGAIAVVGDPLADAASLAAADLSVAQGGTLTLLRGDLPDLPAAVRLGRAAGAITLQNRRAAMVYHPVALALAAAFLPPAVAAVPAALAGVAVVASALRLLKLDPRRDAPELEKVSAEAADEAAEELRMAREMDKLPEPTAKTGPIERRRWVFSGRVQGVGFRYRAQYAAKTLNLTGWVENNMDGTVTLEAQGRRQDMDKLEVTITATSRWIMIQEQHEETMPVVDGEYGFHVRGDY